jgi:hypothetical protein
MSTETLQIVITIVGVCSQLILLGREITKLVQTASTETDGLTRQGHSATVFARIQRGKSILDLSFVVLCAAFFSLLTSDSLIVSGRNAPTGPFHLFIVVLITFGFVATMVTAWYINKTEMVIGFLAIITLIVLIISPGGPFNKESNTGLESGLNIFLIVPVAVLITLAATMMIYSFGSPLSKAVGSRSRTIVLVSLTLVGLFAAIAVGTQIDDYIAQDARTPKFSSPEIKTFARSALQTSQEKKRAFYRYASEICLTEFYRSQFDTSQQDAFTPAMPAQSPVPANASAPTVSPGPAATSTATASPTPPPTQSPTGSAISHQQVLQIQKQTIADMRKSYLDSPTSSTYSFLGEYEAKLGRSNDVEKMTYGMRSGQSRLELLVGKFADSLDGNQKGVVLNERLNWMHPTGIGSNNEAAITLPDKTSENRLRLISKYRLISVLHDQERQRKTLFEEFSYPDEVTSHYMSDAEKINELRARYGYYPADVSRGSQDEVFYKPNLFPANFAGNNDSQVANFLKEQLSLPLEKEAEIAYKEYKAFAAQQVKQQVNNANIEKWLNAFARLHPKSQQALYYSLFRQDALSTDSVLLLLSNLKAKGADFKELISLDDPVKIRRIREQLNSNPPNNINEQLKTLALKLQELEVSDKNTLAALLRTSEFSYTGPSFPVEYLFTEDVLTLTHEIRQQLDPFQQKELLMAVLDPVWYSIKFLSNSGGGLSAESSKEINGLLEKFRNYSHDDQENILHQLAISLYQPGGDHSFDPIRLLIAQVRFWYDNAGWLSATLLCLPVLIALSLLGGYFARLLIMRDRMREVAASEHSEFADVRNTLGTPVDLFGRNSLIKSLKNLAERGWSTIGVVGRRGVGKSRVLHALSVSNVAPGTDDNRLSIRVWVSSPSKFTEEEFISSIYERLALSTESAVANFLGAKPLATRTMENRMAISSSWAYGTALLLLGIIIYYMSTRLSRPDIVAIWIPILVLVFTSLALFSHYLGKLQPVNLTSWLQREKSQNPHTYLLYRDVYKVLSSIKLNSSVGQSKEAAKGASGIGKSIVLGILTFIIAGTALWLAIAIENPIRSGRSVVLWGAILVLAAAALLWFYYFRKTERTDAGWTSGQTLMSLIVDYRTFAANVVYRLNRGALDYKDQNKFTILVCIDELDKIVDFEEIRSFIRRIKAIFEIPGLYYYISIAEDTLRSLYLGETTGKTEVDSAFDHIVRVPPLSCDDGEAIAQTYIGKNLVGVQLPPRLCRSIAVVAFGVPRDIIRRCDEYIRDFIENSEQQRNTAVTPAQLVQTIRLRQLDLAYELQQLKSDQISKLNATPVASALVAKEILTTFDAKETATRLLLLVWLLSLTEIAVQTNADEKWRKVSEIITLFGYKLSDAPIADLRIEIELLHASTMNDSRHPSDVTVTLPLART